MTSRRFSVNQPEDPLSLVQQGAIAQHELYLSWRGAGFTEEQAMELLKAVITTAVQRAVDGC